MHRYRWAMVAVTVTVTVATGAMGIAPVQAAGLRSVASPRAYEPRFEPIPCTDPRVAGDDRVPSGTPNVDCGILTVPENRAKPAGRHVALPLAILRSTDPNKRPDPVVYFSGGPGGDGLSSIGSFLDAHLVTDRDMIFFDQRGTGQATPSLECPEVDAATYQNLETTDSIAIEDARTLTAFGVCRTRLATIADLDQYDTPTTARDVTDLRKALGITDWNVFGISYGTTVAMEVLRSQNAGVRSAVIDSVYPPYVDNGAQATRRVVERVFRTIFDGCRSDPPCAARYPSLQDDVTEISAALDEHPYRLQYLDHAGKSRVANLGGRDVIAAAYQAMYRSSLIPLLPSYVEQIKNGNYSVLDLVGTQLLPNLTATADGDFVSVDCADRQQRSKPTDVAKLRASSKPYQQLLAAPTFPAICKSWNVASVDPAFGKVHTTKIPTLVFGDEYDPITPPSDSAGAARRLGPKARFVAFPGLGHGATDTGPCPTRIFHAFLDAPTAKLDTSCVAQMGGPAWVK